MKKRWLALLGTAVATAAVQAQEITPVWLQHINDLVNVSPENKLPILVKGGGTTDNTYGFSGTDVIDSYANFLKYSDDLYLLGIRENGIDETDGSLSAELRARAAAYPDRSIIWIDATTGKALGIALITEVTPVPLAAPDQTPIHGFWKWGIADGEHGQRAIYTGYKYKILRYAPTGVSNDPAFPNGRATWATTPTEAFVEPVPGEPNPTIPPYVTPDQLGDWIESSGGDGSISWRWKAFRVSGSGNNIKIFAGGATWRSSMSEQEFVTADGGLTFYPIARLNDRGDGCGAKTSYSLGGQPSSIRTTAEGLAWCIQSHYPGTGWEARPNRYVKASTGTNACPDTPWWLCKTCSPASGIKTNQPTRANYFDPVEGPVGTLPPFNWEAAGKDGKPIDHTVDGVQRYDGNWVMTSDTKEGVDYIVTYSIPSWNQQFGNVGAASAVFKPGWVGVHTLDGKISTGNSQGTNYAYKIPVYETDEPIEGNEGTGHDYGYEGDVEVYPDADGKGGALVLWSGGSYGFGVLRVQNIPAAITQQPVGAAKTAGESVTFTAAASGGANVYEWLKDGQPVPLGTSPTLTIERLTLNDAGRYRLRVLNRLGNVESDEVVLSVTVDDVAPSIASLAAANNPAGTASWITLSFSERVTAQSAGQASNYQLSGGASVSEAVIVDDSTVMLKTSALTVGTEYTLTVNNIRDQSVAANTIAANTQRKFKIERTPGALLWEFYADVPGGVADDLLNDANYPDNPVRREFISAFTSDPNLSNIAETFGVRISGWITPADSGDYRFFIRSDDGSDLWLSPNQDPAAAVSIATESACCQPFREPGDDVTQTSAPQSLVAGTSYYIQAIQKENGGGDYIAVAWRKEGDTTAANQLQPIPGEFLSAYRSVSAGEAPKFNLPAVTGGQITLTWTGTGTLQESTDLRTWTNVAGSPASGHQVSPTAGALKFYRLTQ